LSGSDQTKALLYFFTFGRPGEPRDLVQKWQLLVGRSLSRALIAKCRNARLHPLFRWRSRPDCGLVPREVLSVSLAGASEIEYAAAQEGDQISGASRAFYLVAKALVRVPRHERLCFADRGLYYVYIELRRDSNAA
jgi:hypothetical protein